MRGGRIDPRPPGHRSGRYAAGATSTTAYAPVLCGSGTGRRPRTHLCARCRSTLPEPPNDRQSVGSDAGSATVTSAQRRPHLPPRRPTPRIASRGRRAVSTRQTLGFANADPIAAARRAVDDLALAEWRSEAYVEASPRAEAGARIRSGVDVGEESDAHGATVVGDFDVMDALCSKANEAQPHCAAVAQTRDGLPRLRELGRISAQSISAGRLTTVPHPPHRLTRRRESREQQPRQPTTHPHTHRAIVADLECGKRRPSGRSSGARSGAARHPLLGLRTQPAQVRRTPGSARCRS